MNYIWIYLIYVTFTTGYNLESRLPLCKTGEEGSMFGFSVVMHKTSDLPQGLFSIMKMVL